MSFSSDEKQFLLSLRGIGPKVVERLEQIGVSSLADLACAQPQRIAQQMACLVGSSCWQNNPANFASLENAIFQARQRQETAGLTSSELQHPQT